MYEPILKTSGLNRYAVNGFKGINETDSAADNELVYTENVTGSFPSVSTRPHIKRLDTTGADIKRAARLEKIGEGYLFTGIAEDESGVRFFYRNSPVPFEGLYSYTLTAESVCIMGTKIMIFPDKVYFDEDSPENGLRDMTRSESISSAQFYSSVSEDGVITNYISGGSFSQFRRGESVVIRGCTTEENNVVRADEAVGDDIVSAIVEKIENGKMYLLCYTASGEDKSFVNAASGCTVSADIPDMNRVCCQSNRLWGTSSDGSTIYASKLGDPFDFNSFAGISTDSWWGKVADTGEFTGIYPYQNHVYAFKKDCIHEIYGDKPSNFKMPYTVKCGAVDGDSITELDGVMYFASSDGVYEYNGGIPTKISHKLTARPEKSCAAAYDGKLFCVLDGVTYMYETERGHWYRIGARKTEQCFVCADGLFFVSDGTLERWDDGTEQIKWCVQTKEFFRNDAKKNSCVNVWLKLALGESSCAAVYTSADGGEFRRWGIVRGDARTCRVPVRFRKCDTFSIRIEGTGDAKLYGIEFENYGGGYAIAEKADDVM